MKLFITGHGAHGKTTCAKMFCQLFGLTSADSSRFACAQAVFPVLSRKYLYGTPEACYADRRNHRQEWHDLIAAYCTPADRLAREIFAGHDIYCGIRNDVEFYASRELADLSIWVDASERLDSEGSASMKLSADDCDIVIPNNRGLSDLLDRVLALGKALKLSSK